MADKTFKPGGEIIITLGRGKNESRAHSSAHKQGRGILLPSRRNDYLPRRKSKQSFIRVFDAGYVVSGAGYKSLDYVKSAPIGDRAYYENRKNDNSLADPPLPFGANAVTREHYIQLAADVSAMPLSSFFDLAKNIETYRLDFNNGGYFPMDGDINGYRITAGLRDESDPDYSNRWTADGLKLQNDEMNRFNFFLGDLTDYYYQFYTDETNDPELSSVFTKELDYDSERFFIKPTKQMEIVLLPRLKLFQAAATSLIHATNEAIVTWSPAYRYSDRKEFRYDKNFDHYRQEIIFRTNWVRNLTGKSDSLFYAYQYDKILTYTALGVDCSNVLSAPSFTPPPPPDVTGSPVSPVGLDAGVGSIEGLFPGRGEAPVPEHVPQIIIYQNGERYFGWT